MTVETKAPQSQRDLKSVLIPVILVLLGVLVLVYPVVATQWNNIRQINVANEYAKFEKQADPEQLNTALESARQYNDTRNTGPILDPWLAQISKQNNDYQAYLGQLHQNEAMGRLIVPTGQINLPLYHGTDHDTLQKGVGHLFGSDLPVGGEGSHSVLTGHTGLPNATLFDNLKDVKEGDAIYVQVSGEKLKYQVDQIKVVLPNETDDLRPVDGKDYITLVTCTPYGINSHRLLVRGHRVEMDAKDHEAIDQTKGAQWQWWMWALLIGALAVAIALAVWMRRQLKKLKEAEPRVPAMDLIDKYESESDDHE
ncbi:Sortase family protein [Corynebacterium kalinowskii]|uniref:Sortase family protein n=1 Tax=Corynebacterium kalinowskii TaxID=2675216 RepID=A0A6B8VTU9_9CORY|nr:class C sortase [Corynebacterium kalinowskii]QGU03047.1 Sortase family protein [Corynebacterium kalinowskii]